MDVPNALLFDHPAAKALELVETKTFDTGVVVLRYQPAGRNAEGSSRRATS